MVPGSQEALYGTVYAMNTRTEHFDDHYTRMGYLERKCPRENRFERVGYRLIGRVRQHTLTHSHRCRPITPLVEVVAGRLSGLDSASIRHDARACGNAPRRPCFTPALPAPPSPL